jgi:molybdopterin synthase catalytic subunit
MEMKCLVEGPIPLEQITRELEQSPEDLSSGARALFIGQVRNDRIEGREVSGIEYSAYEEMVGLVVEEIRSNLHGRFPDLTCIRILHSTGYVASGEISLLVMVSSGHRKQAFAALEQCVELIKEKLPVWKKELFTDGSGRWIQ